MKLTCPSCETSYDIADQAMPAGGRKVRCARCAHSWHATAPEPGEEAAETEAPEPTAEAEAEATPPAATAEPATQDAADPPDAAPALPERLFPDRDARDMAETDDAELVAAEMVDDPRAFDEDDEELPPRRAAPPLPGDSLEAAAARAARRARGVRSAGRDGAARTLYGFVIGATLAMTVLAVQYRENVVRALPQSARLYGAIGMPVNVRGLRFEALAPQRTVEDGVPTLVVEGKILNIRNDETEVPALHFVLRSTSGDELYNWTIEPMQRALGRGGELPFKTRLAAPPADADAVELRFVDRSMKQAGIRP